MKKIQILALSALLLTVPLGIVHPAYAAAGRDAGGAAKTTAAPSSTDHGRDADCPLPEIFRHSGRDEEPDR